MLHHECVSKIEEVMRGHVEDAKSLADSPHCSDLISIECVDECFPSLCTRVVGRAPITLRLGRRSGHLHEALEEAHIPSGWAIGRR